MLRPSASKYLVWPLRVRLNGKSSGLGLSGDEWVELSIYGLNAFFSALQKHSGFSVPGNFKGERGGEEELDPVGSVY